MIEPFDLITILGHTAGGKTSLAAHLALRLNGEVISADSRQVFRDMNLGTGKDYDDYIVGGIPIPYHLIDILNAGEIYSVFQFQNDFLQVYTDIQNRAKTPILCGGTGLYIESVLKAYKLVQVPPNEALRNELAGKTLQQLTEKLSTFKTLHATTDSDTPKRAIRAIEIEQYYTENPQVITKFPSIKNLLIGVKFDRDSRRRRISQRLQQRLDAGMIDEVKSLLAKGIPANSLLEYGLEYKYITQFLLGEFDFETMVDRLTTAIHQFAKRQMTWFRRMERNGMKIHWLDGYMPLEDKINRVFELIQKEKILL